MNHSPLSRIATATIVIVMVRCMAWCESAQHYYSTALRASRRAPACPVVWGPRRQSPRLPDSAAKSSQLTSSVAETEQLKTNPEHRYQPQNRELNEKSPTASPRGQHLSCCSLVIPHHKDGWTGKENKQKEDQQKHDTNSR